MTFACFSPSPSSHLVCMGCRWSPGADTSLGASGTGPLINPYSICDPNCDRSSINKDMEIYTDSKHTMQSTIDAQSLAGLGTQIAAAVDELVASPRHNQ